MKHSRLSAIHTIKSHASLCYWPSLTTSTRQFSVVIFHKVPWDQCNFGDAPHPLPALSPRIMFAASLLSATAPRLRWKLPQLVWKKCQEQRGSTAILRDCSKQRNFRRMQFGSTSSPPSSANESTTRMLCFSFHNSVHILWKYSFPIQAAQCEMSHWNSQWSKQEELTNQCWNILNSEQSSFGRDINLVTARIGQEKALLGYASCRSCSTVTPARCISGIGTWEINVT